MTDRVEAQRLVEAPCEQFTLAKDRVVGVCDRCQYTRSAHELATLVRSAQAQRMADLLAQLDALSTEHAALRTTLLKVTEDAIEQRDKADALAARLAALEQERGREPYHGPCRCGHAIHDHNGMGLSENIIVSGSCRKLGCGCLTFSALQPLPLSPPETEKK